MKNEKIAVIGLGYVGLPLARLMATRYYVIGYDINKNRVSELLRAHDRTHEVDSTALLEVMKRKSKDVELINDNGLVITDTISNLKECDIYIITVPTPVDTQNKPDLSFLWAACRTVGKLLSTGNIVIFESTVYPGATEEECVPILQEESKLEYNKEFFVGYSPERINPGDKKHSIDKILKVTSGSTPETAEKVDRLYRSVIKAGTYKAPNIKVAEAAKVIENSQRDINIAFVNELAKIFNLMNIDTHEVLKAAGTKWNFLPFQPGLVGGHCIGVDPYYLSQKAQQYGYHPEIILAGRRLNDGMGAYVASEVIKLMVQKDIRVRGANILVLGITFKENCTDVRNSRSVDVVRELEGFKTTVDVYDPWASAEEVKREFELNLHQLKKQDRYDAIILTVAHEEFLTLDLKKHLKPINVIYDVKGILPFKVDGRL